MPENGMPLGTILIAGDDDHAREFLGHLLRSQGYRVLAATDGAETLALFRTQAVDLALLDVLMPRAGGFSVCREVKARAETRLTPVVLVTAMGGADDRMRGIEAGADDFLSKPLRKEELLARVKSLIRMKRYTDELESAETVLCTLASSIEAKDPYTEGHCDRLSRYSVALATHLGLPEEQRVALRRGGMVHDIGKVAVPEQILLKAGPLDPVERRLMETHTVMGEHICAPLKSFRQVLPIIRWHHERRDGSGYPDRLKGDAIPLTARILQTVDLYDALTTDRPYRGALPHQQALATIREEVRRGWWDGALVDAFEAMLDSAPALRAAPAKAGWTAERELVQSA
jgi:putative two-component system response regulator